MKKFSEGSFVVYPVHGVGRFVKVEKQTVENCTVELYVIEFPKERMTLRIPSQKAHSSGLRTLSTKDDMYKALEVLGQKCKHKKAIWSRRAQEYEAKINSGDPCSIAEVIRDLFRMRNEVDQSYSERQVYQIALDRLARELAIIEEIEEDEALSRLENVLRAA